ATGMAEAMASFTPSAPMSSIDRASAMSSGRSFTMSPVWRSTASRAGPARWLKKTFQDARHQLPLTAKTAERPENPGVVATANHCVHAIPFVCAAEPGIKTYLDL
ncbi:hypothetical protein H7I01_00210, partial [Mycobacterium palustre]|nr:hypothetical protein [Mycobacterium palustre]